MLIEVVCDGASRGQGQKKVGTAACGVVVYKNEKEIVRYSRGLGNRSNNEAEYEAVICALLICSISDLVDPIIYSDSAVVVNQVNGKWECKNETLVPLLKSIRVIQSEFRFRLKHVPRTYVHAADALANQFLDELEEEMARIKKAK